MNIVVIHLNVSFLLKIFLEISLSIHIYMLVHPCSVCSMGGHCSRQTENKPLKQQFVNRHQIGITSQLFLFYLSTDRHTNISFIIHQRGWVHHRFYHCFHCAILYDSLLILKFYSTSCFCYKLGWQITTCLVSILKLMNVTS